MAVSLVEFGFLCLPVLAVVGLIVLLLRSTRTSVEKTDVQEDVRPVARQGGLERMRANLRRRRTAAAAANQARAEEGTDDEDGSSGAEEEGADGEEKKLTKKEQKRLARQEAREAREAARQEREQRDAKVNVYEERRRARDAEREAQEQAQEEEMRRAAEEKRRRDEEEAAKWMGQISVEGQGMDAEEDEAAEQGLLQRFVEYLKECKTVELEVVAAHFKLRTADVIKRIQSLEELGRLTGLMDDRGKYIYISRAEMQAMADFIRQRGRVAIAELASKSASFIDLDPKHTHALLDLDEDAGQEDSSQ